MRVALSQMQVGRGVAVLGREDDPEKGGDAAGLHLVRERRLPRSVNEGLLLHVAAVGAPDGVHLDGLIQELAVHVALRDVHVHGGDARVADGRHDTLLLAGPARRGQARNLAVGVHHRAGDGPKEFVLVVLDDLAIHDRGGALQAHGCAAVAADIAVRGGVEAHAAAHGGHPAQHAVVRPPHGGQEDVDAHGDGHVVGHGQTLLLDGLRGDVSRRGTGGSFGRQGDGRALQTETEGESAGVHTELTRDASEALPAGVESPLVGATADVDASRRVHQLLLLVTHGRQRVVALLHEQPLMRVQLPGLVRREVEELVVEELHAVREVAVAAARLARGQLLWVGIVVLAVVPPQERHLPGIVRTRAGSPNPRVHV
mmetsp:Transcript_100714/g.267690  ORF Transcript_100714/g.267690 Transcript_100714/m.267690 type:complete len:371 (-) Transcript_100714:964-2076(-)